MAVSSNDSCVLYIRKRGINWLIAGRGSFLSITMITDYPKNLVA